MSFNKYLPIGTVVILKSGQKKLMITGYTPVDLERKEKIFDYSGCLYPEGIINTSLFLFNHDDIKEIFFLGYNDAERDNFQKVLLSINKDEIIKDINK